LEAIGNAATIQEDNQIGYTKANYNANNIERADDA
jgi:hypothetical protein